MEKIVLLQSLSLNVLWKIVCYIGNLRRTLQIFCKAVWYPANLECSCVKKRSHRAAPMENSISSLAEYQQDGSRSSLARVDDHAGQMHSDTFTTRRECSVQMFPSSCTILAGSADVLQNFQKQSKFKEKLHDFFC